MSNGPESHTVQAAILAELREIKELLQQQGICPHGSAGICMHCVSDMGIGWEIAQALKDAVRR